MNWEIINCCLISGIYLLSSITISSKACDWREKNKVDFLSVQAMVTILPKWTQPWIFCLKKRKALKGISGKQRYNRSILSHVVMKYLAWVYLKTHLPVTLCVLNSHTRNSKTNETRPWTGGPYKFLKFHTWLYEFHTLSPMGH